MVQYKSFEVNLTQYNFWLKSMYIYIIPTVSARQKHQRGNDTIFVLMNIIELTLKFNISLDELCLIMEKLTN